MAHHGPTGPKAERAERDCLAIEASEHLSLDLSNEQARGRTEEALFGGAVKQGSTVGGKHGRRRGEKQWRRI